jgi:hypothetical protein
LLGWLMAKDQIRKRPSCTRTSALALGNACDANLDSSLAGEVGGLQHGLLRSMSRMPCEQSRNTDG